jgi:hypothetical protein
LHVEGGKFRHVGKSTKCWIGSTGLRTAAGRVQPDKFVTIKSILYYNASHVFVFPCYILLFYPIDVGSGFLQNMGI